jgi:hypothetical protein
MMALDAPTDVGRAFEHPYQMAAILLDFRR